MMRILVTFLALLLPASSFLSPSPQHGGAGRVDTSLSEYIPSGMTPEQWKKLKQKEQASKAGKKFGAYGPQSFQSRSMQAFQTDLEKGKANHLLPVFNAKERIKKGELKVEDIPYMQRGGAWDNSDVGGAKKKQWSAVDKTYKANEAPATPDWLGNVQRKGPQPKNQKTEQAKPTKKLFGLF